jgi:hypothetical protein
MHATGIYEADGLSKSLKPKDETEKRICASCQQCPRRRFACAKFYWEGSYRGTEDNLKKYEASNSRAVLLRKWRGVLLAAIGYASAAR